jgi:hypothetical protein
MKPRSVCVAWCLTLENRGPVRQVTRSLIVWLPGYHLSLVQRYLLYLSSYASWDTRCSVHFNVFPRFCLPGHHTESASLESHRALPDPLVSAVASQKSWIHISLHWDVLRGLPCLADSCKTSFDVPVAVCGALPFGCCCTQASNTWHDSCSLQPIIRNTTHRMQVLST